MRSCSGAIWCRREVKCHVRSQSQVQLFQGCVQQFGAPYLDFIFSVWAMQ